MSTIYSEICDKELDLNCKIECELENNSYSTVYKVRDSFSEQIFIIKIFKKYSELIQKEKELNDILLRSESPFFLKYIPPSSYDFLSRYYIKFELASKENLIKYLSTINEGFDETNCKVLLYKVLKALLALHKIGFCHGDIKAQNIFLDGERFNIKIGNFYFSTPINGKNGKIMQIGKTDSEEYMAPEVKRGKEYDGEKADIFSTGVLLFTLRKGKIPFPISKNFNAENRTKKLYKYIKDKNEQKFWNTLE